MARASKKTQPRRASSSNATARSGARPAKTSKAAPRKAARTAAGKAAPRKAPAKKPAARTTPAKKAAKAAKAPAKKAAVKKVAAKKAAAAAPAKAKALKAPAAKAAGTKAAPAKAAVKAAPAKPAPKPAEKPPPPRKPRKPEITPREIEKIRVALIEQRAVFAREFSEIEEGAFNVSQSEMSGEVSFDEEYADAGSFTFEREKELSIGNNIRDLLDKVDHALSAIAHGTYGLCENCGDPIHKARLQALPYSTMCIRCKQQEERTR